MILARCCRFGCWLQLLPLRAPPVTYAAHSLVLNQYLRDEGVPSRVMDMADAGYANTMGGTLQQLGLSQTANMESQFASDGDNDARLEPSSRVVRKCWAQQHDSCQPMTSRLLAPAVGCSC